MCHNSILLECIQSVGNLEDHKCITDHVVNLILRFFQLENYWSMLKNVKVADHLFNHYEIRFNVVIFPTYHVGVQEDCGNLISHLQYIIM